MRVPHTGDLDALAAIFSDPAVMRSYLSGKPFSESEIRRSLLASVADHHAMHGFGALTMCLKPSGTVVGLTGLSHVNIFPNVQLGWILAKDHWGRGLAFESGSALLRYAFETLRLPRVDATTRADNAAAIATIERLGMTAESRFEQDGVAFVRYYSELTRERDGRASN